MNTFKRKISAGQKLGAATFSPSSLNEELRTVRLIWTTGSKGLRKAGFGSFYEELSLDPKHVNLTRLNDGTHPLLAAHDDKSLDSVIGVVEKAWIEGDKAYADVRFAKDEFSERVFQKIKDGILRNVSVGYSVEQYTDVTDDDADLPTYRATRWTPAELSIVPIGFDQDAKVRTQTNNEEFEVEIKSDALSVEETSPMSKKEDTEVVVQENPKVLAERNRVQEIRKLAREANFSDALVDDYIARGVSAEQVRSNVELFAKHQEAQDATRINNNVRVEVGTGNDKTRRDLVADSITARINSDFKPSDKSRVYQGMSTIRLAEEILGGRYLGESDVALAKRAMTSSDFPIILANAAEKSAQNRYELAPRSFTQWVRKDTVNNYKEASVVRGGDHASLLERKENGEFQNGSFSEERELVQLKDYGIVHSFSSQAIVNDDLRLLRQIGDEGGLASTRLENSLVYNALTSNPTMGDGLTLFHANHANIGTGGAISIATVAEAFKLMRKQMSLDKKDTLNISPKYLIVGPDIEMVARQFLTTINPAQTSNVNPYSSMLELVVDAALTGNQYYFASSQVPTVTLFHLAGQESPKIESRIHWETDSLQMKVAFAAAAAPMDWRGLVKNAGA